MPLQELLRVQAGTLLPVTVPSPQCMKRSQQSLLNDAHVESTQHKRVRLANGQPIRIRTNASLPLSLCRPLISCTNLIIKTVLFNDGKAKM